MWAAERGFDAAFSAAEGEVVAGYAVTKEENLALASTSIVQDEYRRQIDDLSLLERQGLTAKVRDALQRP